MVKIGIAEHPKKRLAQLQVGSPALLTLHSARLTDDAEGWEVELHKRFRAQRAHGEWFRVNDEIRAEMANSVECELPVLYQRKPMKALFEVARLPFESPRRLLNRFMAEYEKRFPGSAAA